MGLEQLNYTATSSVSGRPLYYHSAGLGNYTGRVSGKELALSTRIRHDLLTLSLGRETTETLKSLAAEQGTTASALVRNLILAEADKEADNGS